MGYNKGCGLLLAGGITGGVAYYWWGITGDGLLLAGYNRGRGLLLGGYNRGMAYYWGVITGGVAYY